MKKLAIFAADSNFLSFANRFESRVFGKINAKGLKFILQKKLMPSRIRTLSNWADYVLVDFLTPLGIQVSKYSVKHVTL